MIEVVARSKDAFTKKKKEHICISTGLETKSLTCPIGNLLEL